MPVPRRGIIVAAAQGQRRLPSASFAARKPPGPLWLRSDEPHLLEALAGAVVSRGGGVPMGPLEAVVYLKYHLDGGMRPTS